jgi:hypothetical protein
MSSNSAILKGDPYYTPADPEELTVALGEVRLAFSFDVPLFYYLCLLFSILRVMAPIFKFE